MTSCKLTPGATYIFKIKVQDASKREREEIQEAIIRMLCERFSIRTDHVEIDNFIMPAINIAKVGLKVKKQNSK